MKNKPNNVPGFMVSVATKKSIHRTSNEIPGLPAKVKRDKAKSKRQKNARRKNR